MAIYKERDVAGIVSYTVLKYKPALISQLNALGYKVSFDASSEFLRDKMLYILSNEGLERIRTILLGVKIDPSITTQADKDKLFAKFPPDPTAKSIWDSIGDWILPQSTTTGDTSTTTTTVTPTLNKTLLVVVVAIGIIAMIIAYKMK